MNAFQALLQNFDRSCTCCLDGEERENPEDQILFILTACIHHFHETCLRRWVRVQREERGFFDAAECPLCRTRIETEDCDYLFPAYRLLLFGAALMPRQNARFRIVIEEIVDHEDVEMLEVVRRRVVHDIHDPLRELPRMPDAEARRMHARARMARERRDRRVREQRAARGLPPAEILRGRDEDSDNELEILL